MFSGKPMGALTEGIILSTKQSLIKISSPNPNKTTILKNQSGNGNQTKNNDQLIVKRAADFYGTKKTKVICSVKRKSHGMCFITNLVDVLLMYC